MVKILWLSDSPTTCTGYATISTNICNGLVEAGHEVFYQAHNYIGQDIPPGLKFGDGRELKFTVLGTGMHPYSQDLLVPRIRELKPDIFGVLLDTFMLHPWVLNMDFAPAKTIFYFPSDGGGFPTYCDNILRKFHMPVAMSEYAHKQILNDFNIPNKCIPHAVDIKNYHPLSKEEKLKLKEQYGLKGKFVVGAVYRNQGRKMADRMFKAFAKFAKGKDDVILFCHADAFDGAAPFDSLKLIERLKIQNKVVFSGMKYFKGFDYKKMNEVYNIMDIFFLSTSGEGFGVPTIEAMACEVPVVITDYTTTQELIMDNGQCGIPVPIITDITGTWNVDRGVMDIDKGAIALNTLYNDAKMRETFGKIGREKVLKLYNWKKVNKDWNDLIVEMVK